MLHTTGEGKGWKAYSNDQGYLLLFIIVNPGSGAFSRDLPQIWPRSAGLLAGPLKIEKFKVPLFPGPRGRGYKDWYIIV